MSSPGSVSASRTKQNAKLFDTGCSERLKVKMICFKSWHHSNGLEGTLVNAETHLLLSSLFNTGQDCWQWWCISPRPPNRCR